MIKKNSFNGNLKKGVIKKICCGVLAVAMVISGFPQGMFGKNEKTVYAESTRKEYTVGNSTYTYEIDGDTVTITDYEGTDTEIVIPDEIEGKKVVGIGYYAFSGCSSLTKIAIPEGVTSIGIYAFSGCSSLTKIAIPEGVTSISWSTFLDCSSITEIEIPNSVTSIETTAFGGCSDLTEIVIPGNVMSIDTNAFNECNSLKKIIVDEKNQKYDSREESNAIIETDTNKLIKGCKKTIIPNSVTSIGGYAFSGCSGLTKIVIPEGVTEIGNRAFEDCESLSEIEISSSVINIGYGVFSGCNHLDKISVDKKNLKYDSRGNCNAIIETDTNKLIKGCKNTVIPNSITIIGYEAFSHCGNFIDIVIPEGVTEIEEAAFEYCGNLKSVLISKNVKKIGKRSFWNCKNLKEVKIQDGVLEICNGAFQYCESIEKVLIPKSVINIEAYAFGCCTNLKEIEIQDGITEIDMYSFGECISLEKINIPRSVTKFSASAGVLNDLKNLKNIIVDEKNTSYKSEDGILFNADKTELIWYSKQRKNESYKIPESVTCIGNNLFSDCINLKEIEIPKSVISIGYDAFSGCTNLKNINMDKENTNYILEDGVLFNADKTKLIWYSEKRQDKFYRIPESVTSISSYAFLGCEYLKKIELPESITQIYSLGENSSITEVEIPKSVTSISPYAFSGFTNLKSINVDKDNINYKSEEGVLFNAYKTELILYPNSKDCEEYKIPESVIKIEGEVFNNCINLIEITIPNSVESISERAFVGCKNLKAIYVSNGNANYLSIDGVLISKTGRLIYYPGKKEGNCYIIPDEVTSISCNAGVIQDSSSVFCDAQNLEKVVISEGITSISNGSFSNCKSIKTIILSNSVTYIGNYAFENCTNLEKLLIPNSETQLYDYFQGGVFINCPKLTIYGKKNSYVHNYALAYNIPFVTIEELTSDGNITVTYNTDDEQENLKLYTKKLTNTDEEYKNIDFTGKLIDEALSPSDVKFIGYDISLLNESGKTVQPNNTVTVKIPCPSEYDGIKCKVYRAEKNGTFTDMRAVYKNEYLLFETNHFSTYIITETKLVATPDMILGDVNGDGEVDIKDSALIKRHLAGWEVDINMAAADVNEDGDVNIKDSALIKRVLAGWE